MSQFDPTKLFDLLERQIEVADDLIAILNEELTAVISVDINNLMAVSRRKQQQATRLLNLDNTLWEIVEAARDKSTPPQTASPSPAPQMSTVGRPRAIRLSDLLPQLPPEQSQRLAHLRDQMVSRRQQIESKNSTSKRLIEETLGYVGDAIGLITGKLAEKQYRYGGKFKEVKGRPPVFISRSV